MHRLTTALSVCGMLAWPAGADEASDLYDALRLDDLLEVMREEGLQYAAEMEEEMFPGRGGAAWRAVAASIYTPERMEERIAVDVAERLDGTDLDPLLDFFTSARGREIVTLEIEARRALRDGSVEEAAAERASTLRADGDPRMDLLETFVDVNDLVDANVAGALNANYAFYMGLADGGAFDGTMTDDQMVSDVWSQEPEIRSETDEWIHGYLGMAYQPLADDDIQSYIALSRTAEGQALNTAMFGAFDAMYVDISRALGQHAALFMAGEDI